MDHSQRGRLTNNEPGNIDRGEGEALKKLADHPLSLATAPAKATKDGE
jgi:hypothetical protein